MKPRVCKVSKPVPTALAPAYEGEKGTALLGLHGASGAILTVLMAISPVSYTLNSSVTRFPLGHPMWPMSEPVLSCSTHPLDLESKIPCEHGRGTPECPRHTLVILDEKKVELLQKRKAENSLPPMDILRYFSLFLPTI